MLEDKFCQILQNKKNLLSFSYGSDSTALFYLLLKKNIPFDLALINYQTRQNSDAEELKAKNLAKKWDKKIFTQKVKLNGGDFENKARKIRYDFFEKLCINEGYENVILAHQLDDRLEWFFMQLSKGAGLMELMGFNALEKRQNYTLIRPLLHINKKKILEYLHEKKIFYFKDESNDDEKYERNYIRKHFTKKFMLEFGDGVKRSFNYLQKDLEGLSDGEIVEFKGILLCQKNESLIAKALKIKGLRVSRGQREEALRGDCVLSKKFCVVYWADRALIFDYIFCQKMPKNFREECRKAKIPRLLRAFLFHHQLSVDEVVSGLKNKIF